MKKLLLFTILLLLAALTAGAVPARRGIIVRTQPDGTTIQTRLWGDEFGHWVTDAAGNLLEQDEAGWWRPAPSSASLPAIRRRASVRRNAANVQRVRTRSSENLGSPRIPVLLIGFKDQAFTKTAAQFDAMLNQEGYSDNQGKGSVLDYYRDNSFGRFTPRFEVLGPVTLSSNISYYGANNSAGDDIRPEMALVHAAKILDASVDFSRYDNDGDGRVDFILFYFAGHDEAQGASRNSIWSHAWNVPDTTRYDGVMLDAYFCTSELLDASGSTMCRIGTTCHEFAHTLGLPDFYDADYEDNGEAAGTYYFDLMSEGSYNDDSATPPYLNAEELLEVGWLDEIPPLSAVGSYALPALNGPDATGYSAYRMDTDTEGEYFVFEVRGGQAWDAPLPEGMTVCHVDRSARRVQGRVTAAQTWDENTVNNYASHPCCYIVPSVAPASTALYEDYLDFPGNLVFPGLGQVESYLPLCWSGEEAAFRLAGIRYAGRTARFELRPSRTMEETGFNYILDPKGGEYAAGDLFSLDLCSAEGAKKPAAAVTWYFDGEPVSETSVLLTAGSHKVEAEFMTSAGTRKRVELELSVR